MPRARNGDVALYYEATGEGATVLLLGDLGYGAWQWGWQHAAVAGPREVLVADTRGAGRSEAPPGPYAVDDLVGDALAVLDDHGVRSAHLVGAGLGGMVALALAHGTARASSLALIGTAASGAGLALDVLFGSPDDPDALAASLAAAVSPAFPERHPDAFDRIVEWRAAEDAARGVWEAQRAAVRGFDLRDALHEITVPALVVHGTADAAWPPERGRSLAEGLPRGEFRTLSGAGHLCHVEHSRVVNDALLAFLDRVE